jgi:TolA-binding protein
VRGESPASGTDGELAAYRVAHTAHFRGKDPKAALVAWDQYLAKFPDGRMALDARYDRALVLVKLERWAEARAALAPFAAANSTYRKLEATKILDAIRAR